MSSRPLAISDVLAGLCASLGSLADGVRSRSWPELVELAGAIDAWLGERGVEADAPLVFECDNSVPAVAALLALLRREASFVLVPLAPAPAKFEGSAPPSFCRWRLQTRPSADARSNAPEQLLQLDRLAESPVELAPELRGARLLLRTSGSVGAPKLVAHTHASVLANAANARSRLDLRADDRVLIPVPLAHMYGLGAALIPALGVGANVELVANANLLRCLERERAARPTIAFLTPNLAATLVRPRTRAPSHYRHVVVAGDRLDAGLFAALERIYGRVVNLYGSTEMGVVCAGEARAAGEPAEHRASSVGRPLPGVELEFAAPAPHGTEGDADGSSEPRELLCRHPFSFDAYVDVDGRVLARAERPHRTRDLARVDADGRVELLGRCDHAVKRDGRLVPLAEVERALRQLPGVEQAAAIAAGESKRGRGIVAFCSPRSPGAALEPEALRRACREWLPAYAVPDQLHLLSSLPISASGKLDRGALRVLSNSSPPRP
jgi:acyl-CoA synthetase (AMP-forming)/AMP-acid ligase II